MPMKGHLRVINNYYHMKFKHFIFILLVTGIGVFVSTPSSFASDKYGGGSSSGGSSSGGSGYTSCGSGCTQGYTREGNLQTIRSSDYNGDGDYRDANEVTSTTYRDSGGSGGYSSSPTPAPCTTYPNLQVTDILFVVPGTSLTPPAPIRYGSYTGGTTAGTITGVNQNNLTSGAPYEPVVEITNTGCTNTSREVGGTSASPTRSGSYGAQLWNALMQKAEASGGGTTAVRTSPVVYHIDQLPFGQNGTFPVRLRVDFQNDTSYEITEYVNNQGPLAPGARVYVRFPAVTMDEGGIHGINSTVDVTEAEAPGQACDGAEGCVMERGTPSTNTRSETFTVIVPSVQLGSYLLSGPTPIFFSSWYTTIDRRLTNRDLATDTNWTRPGSTYTNVGLYWTGTLINVASCTGTTRRNDGATVSDFNGQVDRPSNVTVSGFLGGGHNLDLQIIEPVASTSHLYTITCQTTTGRTVTDTLLISNGLGNICGPGLVWDGIECSAGGGVVLTGSDCTIPANQSTCNANFSWDLAGALSPQVRNITMGTSYPNANLAVTNNRQPIAYGPNTVHALDGTTRLREITVTARCATSAPWDSARGVCYNPLLVPPIPLTISVTAESDVVRKLTTTVIEWNMSTAIPAGYTCALTGPGINVPITTQNGTRTTRPIDSTSVYTVSCNNGGTPVSGEATVEIIPQVQEV